MPIGATRAGTLTRNGSGSTTSVVVAYPASVVAGELLTMVLVNDTSTVAQFTTPTGWTAPAEANVSQLNGGFYSHLQVMYKVAAGTETGSLTVATASADYVSGQMFATPGVDGTSPMDATPSSTAAAATSTTVTIPSITAVTAGALPFYAASASQAGSSTGPAGSTELGDWGTSTAPQAWATGVYRDTSPLASSGATGTRAVVLTSVGTLARIGIMLLLRPVAALTQVTKAHALSWDVQVRPKVTKALAASWDVRATTPKAHAVGWDVHALQQVMKALAASWDVLVLVAPTHAAAIAASARVPVASVFADWAGTGVLTQPFGDLDVDAVSVEVDRSYATALPDGVGFIEGHAAAELRVEVVGPTADAVNRFNTSSPLYTRPRLAAPITASIGMSGFTPVLQFTGQVRTISTDSRSGVAQLEALDYAERFRFAPALPDVVPIYLESPSGLGPGLLEHKLWMNASWILAEVLAQASMNISPPPLAGTKLYVSLLGSLAPRPGYGAIKARTRIAYGGTPPFISGKFGLALNNTPTLDVLSLSTISWASFTGLDNSATGRVQVEFFALTPYTGGTGTYIVEVGDATAGYVRCTIPTGGTGQMSVVIKRAGQAESTAAVGPVPAGAATWRYYAVHVAFSTTTATVTIRTDAAETVTVVTVGAVAGATTLGVVKLNNNAYPAIQGLQVSNNTAADFTHSTHAATTLDPSMLWLDEIPRSLPGTAWELLTEIAAAEYATIEFSEAGALLYRTADRWTAVTPAVASITATADLLDLAATDDLDTVRNKVIVPISNAARLRYLDSATVTLGASATTTPIESAGTVKVVFDLNTGSPVMARLAEGWIVDSAQWTTNSPTYSETPGGVEYASAGKLETKIEWDGQVVLITTTNRANVTVYIGSSSKMDIVLTPPDEYTATDSASTTSYGVRPYTLPASPWRQQGGGAQAIADRVLADLKNPVAILDRVPVVGDPRRRLGDRVTVKDPTGLGVNQDYWVIGIQTSFQPGSLLQSLTLRPCTT